ncbi:TraR/DksA family transcriptional regulator [Streptomyces hainanensis]|uniref:DNA-binding protein n=1 Tax=Streptomyces hainanensis TaxID=402648 RepID=A0A4R4T7W4_9ACTN|nr:TraR/DksA C4-type zinc finger protein [Streptomyces hainanensis]TDC70763.1 DNA-binding protein [Streptomyces hainanensis]
MVAAKKTTQQATAENDERRPAAAKKAAGGGRAAKKAAAAPPAGEEHSAGTTSRRATTSGRRTAGKTGAKKVAGKKSTTEETVVDTVDKETAVPPARLSAATAPGDLAVRTGEDPWTPEEVAEARGELVAEADRLRVEIADAEASLAGLMRDSGDGAGDDQADTGTKNVTREHEMALATNAREMLYQTERALQRIDAGTYGLCENCGKPIGKARMQAFPRATLCVDCKQRQERRF